MSRRNYSICLILLLILISFINCKKTDSSEKEENYTFRKDSVKKEDRGVKSFGQDPFGLHDEKHNFILYVSNKSFSISSCDIKAYIDGKLIVNEIFEFKRQYKFP